MINPLIRTLRIAKVIEGRGIIKGKYQDDLQDAAPKLAKMYNRLKEELVTTETALDNVIEANKNLLVQNAKMKEALEYVVAHEKSNLEMNPDLHRHDRYRENMYWKAYAALEEGEK